MRPNRERVAPAPAPPAPAWSDPRGVAPKALELLERWESARAVGNADEAERAIMRLEVLAVRPGERWEW
jgi:hypothetical protein